MQGLETHSTPFSVPWLNPQTRRSIVSRLDDVTILLTLKTEGNASLQASDAGSHLTVWGRSA
jgi:hypothetical protein